MTQTANTKPKKTKRDIKIKKAEISYPHIITEDGDGKLVAYSRSSVSWIPTPDQH